ncbi:Chorismate synthase [Quillaja saponaria]|uniref:Chorismate synthase n=1 Tax=Quillaja saponaria TaxID=32244 RepID=A0AAD7Q5T8_QUISA|nr:Chorismate synthase [Quillaja saponaria]
MASSLSSKPLLSASRTDGLSGLSSMPSDLRFLSSVQISICPRIPKKLKIQAAGSTFGTYFRVTTYGESHGGGVGCVIDGCPPRLPLSETDMQVDLDRRRPGQSRITTPRKETDTCRILSGVSEGVTTGTPIHDYSEMSLAYRPSHADATYDMKYGVRSVQGGGRSSARETIGRVASGAVAKKILREFSGTEVLAYVSQVHKVVLPEDLIDHDTLTLDQMLGGWQTGERNKRRHGKLRVISLDAQILEFAEKMIAAIDAVRVRGDSVGGIVRCIVRNCPRGLGSPVFDKLEAELAKAAMSLPATKGFQFGSGFAGWCVHGFIASEVCMIRTRTNRSGGIQGGISNGEIIDMRIAFKPTSTIGRKQHTVTRDKKETELIAHVADMIRVLFQELYRW